MAVLKGRPADTTQTARMERVLSLARLILATCSLLAIYLDPTQPAHYATLAYFLLIAYVLYSGGVFVAVVWRRSEKLTRVFILGVHTVDLCWPALISLFTTGPGSPFFLFFLFVVLAAAYRWGFWETLATTAIAVALLSLEAFIVSAGPGDTGHLLLGEFELNVFIMRLTYLLLAGFLMGYLGEEQRRLRSESSAIARIIARAQAEHGLTGTVRVVLQMMLRLFGGTRVVVAIKEIRSGRAFLWETGEAPDSLETAPRVSEIGLEQQERWFFPSPCHSLKATRHRVWESKPFQIIALDSKGKRKRGASCSFPPDFFSSLGIRSVLMVSVTFEEEWSGRLFLFKPHAGISRQTELRFLQALVQAVSPAIYNAYLSGRLRSRAGGLERARLARELHDGVVQVLSGLELHLEAVRQSPHVPQRMVDEVARIQQLLRQEGSNLRELVQRVTPVDITPGHLVDFFRHTTNKFRLETGIAASFASQVDGRLPSSRVCHELACIVQEALVNVHKHSGARNVSVNLAAGEGGWNLVVDDDGRGFDFSGRLSLAKGDFAGKGPRVIKERVQSIGGELVIESKPEQGAHLEITIPQSSNGKSPW
jgi:signal transduction histidine kinase